MSWNLSTICDAVATAVQTTTGIRATGWPPDQLVPPCHFVTVQAVTPSTVTSAHAEIVVQITTVVPRQNDRSGHQALYRLMSHGIPQEVFVDAAFWVDAGEESTPGGTVRDALWPTSSGDYLNVSGLGFVELRTAAPGALSVGDAEFLAVEHTLTMIARRS